MSWALIFTNPAQLVDEFTEDRPLVFEGDSPRGFQQFVIYANGLALFRPKSSLTKSGLGWAQVHVGAKQLAKFARLLGRRDFQTLAGAPDQTYEMSRPLNSSRGSLVCLSQKSDFRALRSALQKNGIAAPSLSRNDDGWTASKAPRPVAQLLALIEIAEGLPAKHWQPDWIELAVHYEHPKQRPKREVPSEWLIGSHWTQEGRLRVSGRYEYAIVEFTHEELHRRASVTLDGDAVFLWGTAVLPGEAPCRQNAFRGAIPPAELEPQFRLPASNFGA